MITLGIFWDKLLQKDDEEGPRIVPWILIVIV
jgi:hypothetical protein